MVSLDRIEKLLNCQELDPAAAEHKISGMNKTDAFYQASVALIL